jgi:hypothetical protein
MPDLRKDGHLKSSTEQGTRSVKQLKSALEATAHQKNWFSQIRERIKDEPFAIAQATAPHEIFLAMDIPVVVTQWWAAIIAAKRLSPFYLDLLTAKGYRNLSSASYDGALPLACTMDHNPERAPWGGLPKPAVLVAELANNNVPKIFELWAREYGTYLFTYEKTTPTTYYPGWWERIRSHWDEMIEPYRLDLRVEEYKALIRFLEVTTGKTFSHAKFVELMELENKQEDYFRMARDLIAQTVPCPVSVPDQVASVMPVQWHRGTQWAVDQAQMFYEEVKERVDNGIAACKNEKLRLMWLGAGLWHNTAFYQYFEEKYGAVFVYSGYLSMAADVFARDLLGDPLRSLAGRHILFGGGDDWQVKEAKLHKVDGLIMMESEGGNVGTGHFFTQKTFEDAGIPVLSIKAENVDSRKWDDVEIKSQVSNFIEGRLQS